MFARMEILIETASKIVRTFSQIQQPPPFTPFMQTPLFSSASPHTSPARQPPFSDRRRGTHPHRHTVSFPLEQKTPLDTNSLACLRRCRHNCPARKKEENERLRSGETGREEDQRSRGQSFLNALTELTLTAKPFATSRPLAHCTPHVPAAEAAK